MATATSRLKIIIDVLTGKGAKDVSTLDQKLVKLAASVGIAAVATKALKAGLDFAKESTVLAGRIETLGAVTSVMGKTAGKTAVEIRDLEESIKAQGITTQAARQALAQMMRAEIDLAKATDLARLAQDAAVISGDNSSQSFEKLTQIIGTGNTFMARRMGLLVDFNSAYDNLAATLGKSADDLTQLEKVQARTNEVMAQGTTIAGAYEAAMETGGKKASSYARHLEELQYNLGLTFQEPYTLAIDFATETTDFITDFIKVNNMLTDLYNKGLLTRGEAAQIKLEVFATDKTTVDALEELNKLQKDNVAITRTWKTAVKEASKAGVEYADVAVQLEMGWIGLSEANAILNERLDEHIELLADIGTEAADADVAMLGYANAIMEAKNATGEFVGTGEEMEDTQRSIGDEMERTTGMLTNASAAYYLHNLELSKAQAAMDNLNMSLLNTIESWKDQVKWFVGGGAEIQAAAEAAWDAWLASDKSEEAKREFEEVINGVTLATLDLQEELGMITTDQLVEELMKLGWPIEQATAKANELANTLYAITSADYYVRMNIQWDDPGIEFPSGGGGGGGGSTPTGGGGTPGGGGGGVTPTGGFGGEEVDPFEFQHGTGGWRRVPAGYPNDSFRMGLSSGETFNVVPAGGNGGGGMTNNITINSNQDPQSIADEVIRELQFRMN
jgi:hypothetical protein